MSFRPRVWQVAHIWHGGGRITWGELSCCPWLGRDPPLAILDGHQALFPGGLPCEAGVQSQALRQICRAFLRPGIASISGLGSLFGEEAGPLDTECWPLLFCAHRCKPMHTNTQAHCSGPLDIPQQCKDIQGLQTACCQTVHRTRVLFSNSSAQPCMKPCVCWQYKGAQEHSSPQMECNLQLSDQHIGWSFGEWPCR